MINDPGMEGGPVFDKHACLTGILTTPLRQKDGRAEIQVTEIVLISFNFLFTFRVWYALSIF